MSSATFVDIILAILLPPLGVFLKFGCEVEFWICLVLTLFGYLPGIIYAIYIITNCGRSSRGPSDQLVAEIFILNLLFKHGVTQIFE
ncbi:unnamed protein product [Trifolium pratense]|uniref:Uncharacterized protein n=1 Tax=Trifolium pratense TaxID=57577 RepID=A0ACB0IIH6_TRIPR|nr:unnamed protein product [Trifolium pratense]